MSTTSNSASAGGRRWFALVAVAITIALNAAANIFSLGGNTTGEVSAAYPTLFTPAGHTFFIWTVIYLGMALYAWYQLPGRSTRLDSGYLDQLAVLVVASCVANCAWILSWHFRFIGLSFVAIVCLWVCLLLIARLCRTQFAARERSRADYVATRLPFMIYLGWITVAVLANLLAWLVSLRFGWAVLGEVGWLYAALFVGSALGGALAWRLREASIALVLVWALVGILTRHLSASGFNGAYPAVVAVLVGLICLACGVAVHTGIRQFRFGLRDGRPVG